MKHKTSYYLLRGGSVLDNGRRAWAAHCDCGGWAEDFNTEKEARAGCDAHIRAERNKRARETRKAREQANRDAGLVKVRGALGGTYYE